MPLTLEVIGDKAARMGAAARKTFTSGGTIGRLADNDWIFPDEYISGHHARISFTNGAFLIEDTSTNGVFINSPQNRLTRNKPYALNSGDTVFIDDYEVRVTLGAEPAAVESYAPARRGGSSGPLVPDDPFLDGVPGASGVPTATDPLALLGLQSSPAVRPGPSAASLQNQSPLGQHYRPPTPTPPPPATPVQVAAPPPKVPPPGFIPDDYDPMGADEDPFASPPDPPASRPAQAMPPPPPPARPTVAPPSPPTRAVPTPPSAANPTVFTGPPRVPKPGPRLAPVEPRAVQPSPSAGRDSSRGASLPINSDPFEAPDSAPKPIRNSSQERPPPPPAPVPPVRPKARPSAASPAVPSSPPASSSRAAPVGGAGEMDFAAMLEAAGLDEVRVTPELSQQFGQILRVVVAGLMDVLQARNKIKDEFRMRMTTYKQADNNPLKFSVNVEDALHNLLFKRNAAYLGPVEAFEDAFLDVRNHQMAMLAGVRVAYEAMLAEFDPDRLQKEFEPAAKSANFLAGGPKAKYWELYRNRFHDMVKDADSSFRHLFGDDFAKAYEEQLARLKAANRAERK
ncbi:MAG: type VI secretion system-associated FHA domain protein TagH [Steroidobacteraceae bacterium]